MNPIVSVIVPSYNRASMISRTIDSIISQECDFDYEIIIGDDCSKDITRDVLKVYKQKFPDMIRLIFHEENMGIGANWAICAKSCKGKYIATCDDDDYWHNTKKLQFQVDFMESHPSENVIMTNYRTYDEYTGKIKEMECFINRSVPLQNAIFTGRMSGCTASFMFRSSFLYKHVPLDDYIKYKFPHQDWNTLVILSAYTDFYIMPISTVTYCVSSQSLTRQKTYEGIERRMLKDEECYRYICDLFPADLKFDKEVWDAYVSTVLLSMAYKLKDHKKAKELAIRTKGNSLKILCAKNKLLFYILCIIKDLRNKCCFP